MTEAQQFHNRRAAGLRRAFNQEGLAEFMHQAYRAAFKSLHTGRNKSGSIGLFKNCIHEHDHGFGSCHKKAYFMRRAKMLLTDNVNVYRSGGGHIDNGTGPDGIGTADMP